MAIYSFSDLTLAPFKILSEKLPEIREAKNQDLYGRAPYVKLQTKEEGNPKELQIFPYIIGEGAYSTYAYKMYAGTRNFTANTLGDWLNGWSSNYTDFWHCDRNYTAEALKTANEAFFKELLEWNKDISNISKKDSQNLSVYLSGVEEMLRSAQKTVYYVYRTYASDADQSSSSLEIIVNSNQGPEGIHAQYEGLSWLIEQIEELKDSLLLVKPLKNESTKKESVSPRDACLMFKDELTASRWFLRQRESQRKRMADLYHTESLETIGLRCIRDLNTSASKTKRAPEGFVQLGKSLDAEVKKACRTDKIRSSNFVAEVYHRFTERLSELKKPNLIEKSPDSFKAWLKELCMKEADLETYQTLFRVLMNSEGTGPYQLELAPSALNAIMISNYFGLFNS